MKTKFTTLAVHDEFSKLKSVFLASALGSYTGHPPLIDPQSVENAKSDTLPKAAELVEAQKKFTDILKKHQVTIIWAHAILGAENQIFTRDPFMTIGNRFVVNHMKEKGRQMELAGAHPLLQTIDPSQIIYTPHHVTIEGGDVIPHGKKLFVGQNGLRTDAAGLDFLKKNFGKQFDVIPIYLKPNRKGTPMLHLDCAFNPVWHDTALVFPDGITEQSLKEIQKHFPSIIKVSEEEQNQLGTNVFSLGNKKVIVQDRHQGIIDQLKSKNFQVEPIHAYATAKLGGYSRCITCPTEREQ